MEDWGPGGVAGAAGAAIGVAGGAAVGVAGDAVIRVAGFSSLSLVLIRLDMNWPYLSLYL